MKNKYILLILLVYLPALPLIGQLDGQAKIDSLLKELPKTNNDTNKINILIQLADSYSDVNAEKGIIYSQKALDHSKNINWKLGIAKSHYSIAQINYALDKIETAVQHYKYSLGIYKKLDRKIKIASIMNDMGIAYELLSEYQKALNYYKDALKINREIGDLNAEAMNLGNMGIIYAYQSDYSNALESFHRSLKISEKLDNNEGKAIDLGNIGNIYNLQSNYKKAIETVTKALQINKQIENQEGIANNYILLGNIYTAQKKYKDALEFYEKASSVIEKYNNDRLQADNLANIGNTHHNLKNYEKAMDTYRKALEIDKKLMNKRGIAYDLGNIGKLYLDIYKHSGSNNKDYIDLSIINLKKSISIYSEIGELDHKASYLKALSDAYLEINDFENSLNFFKKYVEIRDTVFSQKTQTKIANLEAVRNNELKDKELKIKDLELEKSQNQRWALIAGLGGLALIIFIIYRQRQKTEKLLYNILPVKIAKRLKKNEREIADDIDNASIIFIDLVGFTTYSKDKRATEVVSLLNSIFLKIDKLVLKHKLEKIKTIGDGYMAASGVPEISNDHALKAAKFAKEVLLKLDKFNKSNRTNIQARIGIESGPIVAGVIGDMKFSYDLWGDTVNTASRMESHGIPNEIQVGPGFKEALSKHDINDIQLSEREEIEVKGKGKMQTYILITKNVND